MVALTTPVCEFNQPAHDFRLQDTEGKWWTLEDCRGPKGLLVMFICNHCPYVQAILPRLVHETRILKREGISSVAIMSNDISTYPEDAPQKMKGVADHYHFSFPYLYDETEAVARSYGAVCTPDFFGYNAALQLQYRGQFDGSGRQVRQEHGSSRLLLAMQQIAKTGEGPLEQLPSIGCSIKWRNDG